MNSESDDLISSIAPDVMGCLEHCGYFKSLDDILSPKDESVLGLLCDGSYKISRRILEAAGFDKKDMRDIVAVLNFKSACCDCEVLYNVAEESRLKANIGATVEPS